MTARSKTPPEAFLRSGPQAVLLSEMQALNIETCQLAPIQMRLNNMPESALATAEGLNRR